MVPPEERTVSILVEYAIGAYGPTIRIDVLANEDLARIKGLCLQMAQSEIGAIDFCRLDGVKTISIRRLEMRVSPERRQSQKRTELLSGDTEDAEFLWAMPPSEWKHCADLMRGLIDGGYGHQYLVEEDCGDAIIVVAFGEWSWRY